MGASDAAVAAAIRGDVEAIPQGISCPKVKAAATPGQPHKGYPYSPGQSSGLANQYHLLSKFGEYKTLIAHGTVFPHVAERFFDRTKKQMQYEDAILFGNDAAYVSAQDYCQGLFKSVHPAFTAGDLDPGPIPPLPHGSTTTPAGEATAMDVDGLLHGPSHAYGGNGPTGIRSDLRQTTSPGGEPLRSDAAGAAPVVDDRGDAVRLMEDTVDSQDARPFIPEWHAAGRPIAETVRTQSRTGNANAAAPSRKEVILNKSMVQHDAVHTPTASSVAPHVCMTSDFSGDGPK